jgi:hypothetical protein
MLVSLSVLLGLSVISAQLIQNNPNSATQACHIFPVRSPNNEVYPSSMDVLYATDATNGGCYASCQYCYQNLPQGICVDHYGCHCEQFFNGLDCKGKPFKMVG